MRSENAPVLLLNSTYEPLNVINLKRAIRLILGDKADTLEGDGRVIRHGRGTMRVPEVVRLSYYVRRPTQRVKFTKSAVMLRDGYRCQYCGVYGRDLTIDHVVPRVKGGKTTWTNVVAACKRCNNAKGDQSLKEFGARLEREPREPRFLPYLRTVRHGHQKSWDRYLFLDNDSSTYLIRDALPVAA